MYAVIKTGGKQYKVAANDTLQVDRLPYDSGAVVVFPEVLLIAAEGATHVGSPLVAGAQVAAEVVAQVRTDTIIAFKKRRRQNSKRKRGNRQQYTLIKITEILTDGKQPSRAASAPIAKSKSVSSASTTASKPVAKAAVKASAGAAGLAASAAPAKATASNAEAKAATSASSSADRSNLSLISGVGPTIEKKLRAAGITTWDQIASWTEQDVEKWDKELALRGRATREEWVEQAKELIAGKPPRAKIDKAEQASGKDK